MKTAQSVGWRIGDAGRTIFGPPNGEPSPVTIANVRNPEHARAIVAAVNERPALLECREALAQLVDLFQEAHRDEIDNGHGGDDPATCSYCRAIADARGKLANAGGAS